MSGKAPAKTDEAPKAAPKAEKAPAKESAKKAAPAKKSPPAMTDAKVKKIAMEAMSSELGAFQGILDNFKAQLDGLEKRFGRLEISAPADLRALEHSSVAAIVKADPYAEFEVLVDWKHASARIPAGRKIRADHYPHLLDYVRAGLRLGRPENQEETVAKYRAEAEERARIARKEAQDRADAHAAEMKAKADALRNS